ncbi:hypothetical protein [Priestia sp. JSM ZJ58]|uniref:hypothetical protein n=1 Tax=Priestia sp. JSM ZJ58 TaxID=3376189 RepID=UPI00379C08C9
MEPTIVGAFTGWVINGVVSGITANLTYDKMKQLKPKFVERFKAFFDSSEQTEEYFKCIGETVSKNVNKPIRDIEDSYELVAKQNLPDSFISIFREWILENKEDINKMASSLNANSLNIGTQNAGRDIINVQGRQTINNYGGDK